MKGQDKGRTEGRLSVFSFSVVTVTDQWLMPGICCHGQPETNATSLRRHDAEGFVPFDRCKVMERISEGNVILTF